MTGARHTASASSDGTPRATRSCVVSVTLPLKLVNGANAREHWAVRKKRAESHRQSTTSALALPLGRCGIIQWENRVLVEDGNTVTKLVPVLQCKEVRVRITRISAGKGLDRWDGLPIACKHVIDGVADALGIDDSDPRFFVEFAQEKGPRGYFGCRVEVWSGDACAG